MRMKHIRFFAAAGVIGLLTACAQQEEPTMVAPEPMFDKYGGGSCEGDWIYVPGTVPEFGECVPPGDCNPVYDSAGNVIDCRPPPREREGGDDNGGGSTPTGAAGSPTAGP